jgi:aldehyde dehydrogenase (NAD+)
MHRCGEIHATVPNCQMMFERNDLFIGGDWIDASSNPRLDIVSPVTEECIGSVPEASLLDVEHAVSAARNAFDEGPWPRMRSAERIEILDKLGVELEKRSSELRNLTLAETGFPVSGTAGEDHVPTGLFILREYLRAARSVQMEEWRASPRGNSTIYREPVGVAVGILPWNGPFAQSILKLIPPLVTGCSIILKPAPETPLDAYVLAEAVQAAGIPNGVVSILAGGREVGEALAGHPAVDKVSLTGSTVAGRRVASVCGGHLTRCTLELGGKSAAVIFDDANLSIALPSLIEGGFALAGQQCYALSRVLIQKSRYDEVVAALSGAVDNLIVGDPRERSTDVGPLIAERQRRRVNDYIRVGLDEGASIATDGDRSLPSTGWYVRPTVFRDVKNDMRIAREEIFGPVVVAIPFDDEDEAIHIANDSDYGLSGAVFTETTDRGIRVARGVRTGTYTINGFTFNLSAPFGGFKQSGIGREWGPEGLAEFTELKTVTVL